MSPPLEFDTPPFREKIVIKRFEKKTEQEISYHSGLAHSPIMLRRFPDYDFRRIKPPVAISLMKNAYERLNQYEHLGAPKFMLVRANIFRETDSRLNTHYLLVEEIQGKNIQRFRPNNEEERLQAKRIFDVGLTEISQYARDIYTHGGFYDSDQQTHQYVYGYGKNDTTPKLYYVDLDFEYLREYNPKHRKSRSNENFYSTLISSIGGLIVFSEDYIVKEPLNQARLAYVQLLTDLRTNDHRYRRLIGSLKEEFDNRYESFSR